MLYLSSYKEVIGALKYLASSKQAQKQGFAESFKFKQQRGNPVCCLPQETERALGSQCQKATCSFM